MTSSTSSGRRQALAAFGCLIVTAATASALAADEARLLRVGLYENEPKVFTGRDGKASGIFPDVLAELAQREGWSIEYVRCEWAECLQALKQGRLDLMPDVAYSQQRDVTLDFHRLPVLESWSQLYTRSGLDLMTLADVDGKRIAVLRDSIQHDEFVKLVNGFGHRAEILPTGSLDGAFELVSRGEADVAVANHFFGDRSYRSHGLRKAPVVFLVSNLHFATGQGRHPEILATIDGHLEAWRDESNSPYYAARARWMEGKAARAVPGYLLWIVAIGAGLLALVTALALLLRAQVRNRTRHLARANEDLRRTRDAFDEERKQLLSVFDSIEHAICITDPRSHQVLFANRLLRQQLGTDPVGGKCHGDVSARGVSPLPLGASGAGPGNGQEPHGWEHHDPACDRDYWLTTRTVGWPDGRDVRLETALDITDQKRVHREKEELAGQLRHAQKLEAVGSLAGGIAHDFNNLLMVIDGYASLAAGALAETDPAFEDLRQIQEAGRRAAELTQHLLAFSRKQVLQPRLLDVNEVIGRLEAFLFPLLGEDIRLSIRLGEDLGLVEADPGQLEQAIMNLVVNARDAMPDGGELSISTAAVEVGEQDAVRHGQPIYGPHVRISVSDTGCGMDEEAQQRAFDPFFTTKEPGKGTGLGLSMVYGIITQSGGHVRLTSEPDKGSTFEVVLPRADSMAAKRQESERPAAPAMGRETILLVEDEPVVRDLVERMLRTAGYTVLSAGRVQDAIRICGEHQGPIDLLLTDVVMPLMNGRALAEHLARLRAGMSVLFMSGHGGLSGSHAGRKHVEICLRKPFSRTDLLRAVRAALDGSRRAS